MFDGILSLLAQCIFEVFNPVNWLPTMPLLSTFILAALLLVFGLGLACFNAAI